MKLSTKQKQTHRHREHTCCQGGREGVAWLGSLGLVEANLEWISKNVLLYSRESRGLWAPAELGALASTLTIFMTLDKRVKPL